MKVTIGKVETVLQEVINDEGDKHKIPFIKLSVYCDFSEFPDALSFNKADMFLYRNQAEANEGDVTISPELKDRLTGVFRAGLAVLEDI